MKRYRIVPDYGNWAEEIEDPNGEWVKYEDVQNHICSLEDRIETYQYEEMNR